MNIPDNPRFIRKGLRALVGAMAITATLCAGMMGNASANGELNVYNWSDYIADNHVENFSKQLNIKVRYDNFDSNETLHAKVVAGGTGYDVIVPTANFGKIQADAGLLLSLDKSKIPNYKNLDQELMKKLAVLDPDNKYLIPWAWGYNTIGINVDKVKAALGNMPMPDNEWDLLFDPKYVSKLKSCGVSVLDSASEVIPSALFYLGKPPYSKDQADYQAVGKLLESIRPSITLFSGSGYINELANGAICLAFGWSGDIGIAASRAKEAKNGQNIQLILPKKGAIIFYDTMAIPKDAKNVENAYKWINYYLDPKVAATMTNKVKYANPVEGSVPFVDKAIAENKAVFPDATAMARMKSIESISNDQRRIYTRIFTRFKTGI